MPQIDLRLLETSDNYWSGSMSKRRNAEMMAACFSGGHGMARSGCARFHAGLGSSPASSLQWAIQQSCWMDHPYVALTHFLIFA